jgi:3-hydroxyisobutyrate dehydrogenase-like beta-hydroxyacid dehydrogenase
VSGVAVIGLGAMGARIAQRLLDAGHEVSVWNRTAAKMTDLADRGALPAHSPAAAAHGAEAVITMVADAPALAAVTTGPDGVLAGMSRQATLIQMATVGLAPMLRLAASMPPGTGHLLDAPVLGSLSEVEAGSLTVFAAGPEDLVQRWRPLLSALGTVLHVGPAGAGAAAKLIANSTLFGALGVLGEAIALGEAIGLPREVTFEVLSRTPLGAQADRRRQAVTSGDYPLRFALGLALKDCDLVADAAEEAGAQLRLGAAARSWYADAVRAGQQGADYSAIIAHMLDSVRPDDEL